MNKELFERGLQTRREVLGAEHVDASIRSADDFYATSSTSRC